MNRQLTIIIYVCVFILMVFLSFIFSSADMSYGSCSLTKLEAIYRKDESKKKNKYAYKLSENYDKTISTILLLNDTVNAGLDSVSTLIGVNLCFLVLGETELANMSSENWGFIASLICLVIKITFGEIIAKSIGKIYNYRFAAFYSRMLNALQYVFYPVTFFVSGFGNIVSYPIRKNVEDIKISEEELHEMVDEIEDNGLVDEEKADLLHGTIDYAETEAYEIMTPRVNVYAVEVNEKIDDILKEDDTYIYSRIPVYEESVDNILGYVLTKSLVRAKLESSNVSLRDLIVPALTFPRSTEINNILIEFKKTHKHFAVILDEYGGVEGVLTMEDILEEIVGEIWDESDDISSPYSKKNDGTYIVDGKMNLEDFCELFDLDYDDIETDYVTIGGFCVELLDDKFASINTEIRYKNLLMKVIAIDDKHTIETLLVKVLKEDDSDK